MAQASAARAFHEELSTRVDARLFGMREPLQLVLIGILTGSHVLIDDVPGVGKTTLVRMLAGMLDLSFQRVQFTPDLMPTDITGTSVLEPAHQRVRVPARPALRPGAAGRRDQPRHARRPRRRSWRRCRSAR